MNAVAFDTLKFARTLQEQGSFTIEQSSSLVEALGHVLASDLTTKADLRETEIRVQSDLKETELRLQADLREAELRLEAKISEVKTDILKSLFGTIGFQTLVILGAVTALARVVH